MKKILAGCLMVVIAIVGLGNSASPPSATAQDDLTCEDRYFQADDLLKQRDEELAAGNVIQSLNLIRQVDDLLAPCIDSDLVTGLFQAGDANQWVPVTREFDGIPMVQVPGGCFMMGSETGEANQQPTREVCFYTPYWLDQTEVTRAMYAECVANGGCTTTLPSDVSTQDNQPVNRVTWYQAEEYCAWRGMQLPTEAEWEYAARGPAGLAFPWGNDFVGDDLVYGVNSGGVPAEVGTPPAGASWVGALNMSGNVAEWTRTVYHAYPYNPAYNGQTTGADSPHVIRGGAYHLAVSSYLSNTYRNGQIPTFEFEGVGFRCVNVLADLPETPDQAETCPERIQQARDLLVEEQGALIGEHLGFALLLMNTAREMLLPCAVNASWSPVEETFNQVEMMQVPPGCFTMGRDDNDIEEQPAHQICIDDSYWLDKTEVTRGMYADCVAAGVCTETPPSEYSTRDIQPINRVTWFQARTYCSWRGARLPTEAEWEYAARGPEGWLFPWGNDFAVRNAVYAQDSEMADVGSLPGGASWVGALDMSGNAGEWVNSLYQDYPYSPDAENESDATTPRVVRGGSFYTYSEDSLSAARRNRAAPDSEIYTNGFRCARDG